MGISDQGSIVKEDAIACGVPEPIKRRHATILFSDIASSTQLAELCDPESLAKILGQVGKLAERISQYYGGVANQIHGDGALIVFGFPEPQENEVIAAIRAAIDLHRAVEEMDCSDYLPKSFTVKLHTGIHAGLIVAAEGDCLHGRYKLTGDALNTASRLSDAAQVGEILVSESTLRGVLPYFEVGARHCLSLKGKRNMMVANNVLRRSPIVSRYDASVSRGLLPFVGREKELHKLLALLTHVDGQGVQLALVTGSAGVGKTRFVEYFIDQYGDDCEVYRLYCSCDDSAIPLQPFVQLFRQFLGLQQLEPCKTMITRLLRGLAENNDSLLGMVDSVLAPLLLADAVACRDDFEASRLTTAELSAAVDKLITRLSQRQPKLIFIDDWHWADDGSLSLIQELLSRAVTSRVLVIVASRALGFGRPVTPDCRLYLEPFERADADQVIAAFFQKDYDVNIADAIYRRSGGNPLFIEELCREEPCRDEQCREERYLGGQCDNVPAILHGLIESRLEYLSDDYRALIRTAAVIGNRIPRDLFEQVLGYQLSDELLLELAQLDFLHSDLCQGDLSQKKGNSDCLYFKHGLTRDIAYQSVLLDDRKSLHLRVASILETDSLRSPSADQLESLAYHFSAAEVREKAVHYTQAASARRADKSDLLSGVVSGAVSGVSDD